MTEDDRERSIHAHPLEVMSLTLGLLFMISGLVFAVVDVDLSEVNFGWVAFAGLGAAGLMTLAAAVRRHRASGTTADHQPT